VSALNSQVTIAEIFSYFYKNKGKNYSSYKLLKRTIIVMESEIKKEIH